MNTSIIGYPRIGKQRELKFALEKYFRYEIDQAELETVGRALRTEHWVRQREYGIGYIPSNDFSYYDGVLDTACLLHMIPERYTALELSPLDTYFAMARGYQGNHGDVKALSMRKWFNTNYHYMVPEIDDNTAIFLAGDKPFAEFLEAKAQGILTKPVLVGAFTLLKLARFTGERSAADCMDAVVGVYAQIIRKFDELGAPWVQFDEPCLVQDVSREDIALFEALYARILKEKGSVRVLLQTYFGDIRNCYTQVTAMKFDGIGLDFIEGKQTAELIEENGFPSDKTLFAGLVNGKNIWRSRYEDTLKMLEALPCSSVVLSTSCSLLHVPYTLKSETKLTQDQTKWLAFAEEKLTELSQLQTIINQPDSRGNALYQQNAALFTETRIQHNAEVRAKVTALSDADFIRQPAFAERERIQKQEFRLPLLPTTTIGSFPQTADVKKNRTAFRRHEISLEAYKAFNRSKIKQCVVWQEALGLDVLVHGEFERNDMVEYFGENLRGFLFTEKAWVQSYGTRCVKPPIVWEDVYRENAVTVEWSVYAQSLTNKPMKGMLTGPVTILNWSFPREDISLKECTFQIAAAIREEVLDLEANGIRIIQIDEAALREKLPLRHTEWQSEYLDWAIPAFRFVHSGVKPQTQIHTHMCYSEFGDIITAIDDMDADVITFEASRSDLTILDVLKEANFRTEVGPGVYDIHSPRVPSVDEIKMAIEQMLKRIPIEKLWVNPDCGLKTRGDKETKASLANLVAAAKQARTENR